jgi:maleate isomerase
MSKPKRIGVLIPSTNTSVEADFQRVHTPEFTVHASRLFIPQGEMTAAFLDEMNKDLAKGVELLASAEMDLIVYACTSGSFYKGPAWDAEVTETVSRIAGVPCVTTSTAVLDALRHQGIARMSVITPYPAWTNEKLREYYEHAGFTVASIAGDERAAATGHRAINDQDPREIVDFAREHIEGDVDGLFCSCTAWRALEAVEDIEKAIAKPVVTSNQATVWAALRAVGIAKPLPDLGSLLRA